MHRQILTPLVVLVASASLVIAVPRATAHVLPMMGTNAVASPGSSIAPVSGPPDPWLQSLYAQARFKNVQAIDPWQSNLYARKANETRKVAVPSRPASTGGFGWDDAGIGAGVMFGTLLVGTAGVVSIRRNRRPIAH